MGRVMKIIEELIFFLVVCDTFTTALRESLFTKLNMGYMGRVDFCKSESYCIFILFIHLFKVQLC